MKNVKCGHCTKQFGAVDSFVEVETAAIVGSTQCCCWPHLQSTPPWERKAFSSWPEATYNSIDGDDDENGNDGVNNSCMYIIKYGGWWEGKTSSWPGNLYDDDENGNVGNSNNCNCM